MPRPSSSLHWLTLAVLLPLLVLGVLAWLGVRAQVSAAWTSAREEAKVAGALAAEEISSKLTAAVETVLIYPDPPPPGPPAAADDVLNGGDLDALRRLRDDPDAGLSPAGLPRRVLAGFRICEIVSGAKDRQALLEIATRDAPSVLTPIVVRGEYGLPSLDGVRDLWSGKSSLFWEDAERARKVFKQHPELVTGGGWIPDGGKTWWMSAEPGILRTVSPWKLEPVLADVVDRLPAWAGLRFASRKAAGAALAVVPVDFPGAGSLEIIALRPKLFEAAVRQQARWTLGLLAVAVAISGGALFFIHRAVERERRLNAMKSDFVASVSHELRAPVASIRLMADALNAGKIAPHTVSEFHRLISREGARLTTLIENVLDFARIEQGRKRWHFEQCNLAEVIHETLGLMEPLAAEKSITLVSPEPFPSLFATVDPGAIQQALVNLLDNAIKFSPPGSTVEVRLTESPGHWEIQITDQGPGIPPAEHARIFEKFHRLGSELRRETQGTGIGLSLVKAIAEAHGGQVLLASLPGQGSSFMISAPITHHK